MYWIGLDIGTGGSRALLLDARGSIRASYTALHEQMRMERPQWAEQEPRDWWKAAVEALRGVVAEAEHGGLGNVAPAVKGIGLSGQMHGLVILDKDHRVIRPSLIWCDQRSQEQVDSINSTAGREMVLAETANPVLTGFTLPKLLWVRDHEPANYERVRQMLLPKDYIRFQLTGEYCGDVSDASGTALFHVVERRWAWDLASKLGIDRSILPRVVESQEISGTLHAVAAELTGLPEGIPVVGGAGDQAASAVGNGIVEPGFVSCTLGTSGVVFAHMDAVAYDPQGRVHTFCHAVPGKWHVMGVTQGAGLSLQWLRNQLMPLDDYDVITAEGATAEPGSQGLYWLPYLMGERTPHLDALARGGWIGLTAKHTRADLIRSVIEGVSYSQKDCLEIIAGLGVAVAAVRASGGGAKSIFWRQLLADVFERPIVTLASQEGSAYGAGLLAMTGTGHYSSVGEACGAVVAEADRREPKADSVATYRRGYAVYRSLYPALKPLFPAMGE